MLTRTTTKSWSDYINSRQMDFRARNVIKDQDYFLMTEGSVHQDNLTVAGLFSSLRTVLSNGKALFFLHKASNLDCYLWRKAHRVKSYWQRFKLRGRLHCDRWAHTLYVEIPWWPRPSFSDTPKSLGTKSYFWGCGVRQPGVGCERAGYRLHRVCVPNTVEVGAPPQAFQASRNTGY